MKKILLSKEAQNDLVEIWAYVSLDSPIAATELIKGIHRRIKLISQMPGIGRQREELARNLQSFIAGTYILFYRVKKNNLEVVRILHGSRDVNRLF